MKLRKFTSSLDGIGMAASTLCALHCLLLPLLATVLPLWSLSFLAKPWVEHTVLASGIIIGGLSLGISYFRHHCNLLPLLLFLAGFGLILVIHMAQGHFHEQAAIFPSSGPAPAHHYLGRLRELMLLFLGGLSVAAAHLLNWWYTHRHHQQTSRGSA